MGKVEQLFEKMPADEPDQSFQHYIDRSGVSSDVREHALRYVEGFHAADPTLISVHSFIRDIQAEGTISGDGKQFRFAAGYEGLVHAIKDRIAPGRRDVLLKNVVTEINWRPGEVVAKTTNAEFHTPRVIITVPLGVLKAKSIAFLPALPEKENAIRSLEMGAAVRVTLCFRTKFWEQDPEMADLSFLSPMIRNSPRGGRAMHCLIPSLLHGQLEDTPWR